MLNGDKFYLIYYVFIQEVAFKEASKIHIHSAVGVKMQVHNDHQKKLYLYLFQC